MHLAGDAQEHGKALLGDHLHGLAEALAKASVGRFGKELVDDARANVEAQALELGVDLLDRLVLVVFDQFLQKGAVSEREQLGGDLSRLCEDVLALLLQFCLGVHCN